MIEDVFVMIVVLLFFYVVYVVCYVKFFEGINFFIVDKVIVSIAGDRYFGDEVLVIE